MGISAAVPYFPEDFFRTVIVFPILFNLLSADLSKIGCTKILRNTGNGCRNSHLILSCFMQLGPGLSSTYYLSSIVQAACPEPLSIVYCRIVHPLTKLILTSLHFTWSSLSASAFFFLKAKLSLSNMLILSSAFPRSLDFDSHRKAFFSLTSLAFESSAPFCCKKTDRLMSDTSTDTCDFKLNLAL